MVHCTTAAVNLPLEVVIFHCPDLSLDPNLDLGLDMTLAICTLLMKMRS